MAKENEFIRQIDQLLGSRISALRVSRRMGSRKLAQTIGVSQQQLSKYEKGINRVCAGRLILIASALGAEMRYFYEGLSDADREEGKLSKQELVRAEVIGKFSRLKHYKVLKEVNKLVKSLIKAAWGCKR
jgi:transcriptional regulator with XRE-family HTH domain